MLCLSLSRPWELLFLLMHFVFRFLPSSSSHLCWKFHIHILTLTSVIPTSLFFPSILSYSIPYPLTALYYSTNISYSKLFFYVFITFTIRHSIPSERAKTSHFCRLHCSHFSLGIRIRRYESTSMSFTAQIKYVRKGCFWHFRKNVSFICPQNCWHLHTTKTVNFSLLHALCHCGGLEVWSYWVLKSVLDGGGWSLPMFAPRKDSISIWYLHVNQ